MNQLRKGYLIETALSTSPPLQMFNSDYESERHGLGSEEIGYVSVAVVFAVVVLCQCLGAYEYQATEHDS